MSPLIKILSRIGGGAQWHAYGMDSIPAVKLPVLEK